MILLLTTSACFAGFGSSHKPPHPKPLNFAHVAQAFPVAVSSAQEHAFGAFREGDRLREPDLIALCKAKVSEDILRSYLLKHQFFYNLNDAQISELRSAGASEDFVGFVCQTGAPHVDYPPRSADVSSSGLGSYTFFSAVATTAIQLVVGALKQ